MVPVNELFWKFSYFINQSKFINNFDFRGCICKILNETKFVVYSFDYGDYNIVSLGDLQPLPKCFLDLPHQAIKAKLSGKIIF